LALSPEPCAYPPTSPGQPAQKKKILTPADSREFLLL
jgi:hypothetical protein